jgi:hypothetical protein
LLGDVAGASMVPSALQTGSKVLALDAAIAAFVV